MLMLEKTLARCLHFLRVMKNMNKKTSIKMQNTAKHLFVASLLIAIFILSSCSEPIQAPVLPEWDVQMNIPIVAQDVTLEELLTKGSDLQTSRGEDGLIIIEKSFPLKSIRVGDSLRISETRFGVSKNLGLLTYEIPNLVNKEITLASTFNQLTNGTYVVSPQTNSNLIDVTIDVRNYFESLTFAEGQINLHIKNNFPIPLTSTQPLMISDAFGNPIRATSMPVNLQPGETATLTPIDLKGVRLTGIMKASFVASTPGSNGMPVVIDKNQSISISASITKTKIAQAIAKVPEQSSTYEQKINLSDQGIRVRSGEIKSGYLNVDIKNYIPVGASAEVFVEGIEEFGKPLTRSLTIEPHSSQNLRIPLQGFNLIPINETELRYVLKVKTVGSTQAVTISSNDSVSLTAVLNNVYFKSLSGKVETRSIDLDQTTKFDFATNGITGGFKFDAANMWIDLQNGVALPVELQNGYVKGVNTITGKEANITIAKSKIGGQSKQVLAFNTTEITNFINTFGVQFPNRITLKSKAVINPENTYGTVLDTDSITGTMYLEIPLNLSVKDGSWADTTEVTLDKTNRKRLGEVKNGTLNFTIENGLPIGVKIEPEFMDAEKQVILMNASSLSVIEVPAASVDQQGRVTQSTPSTIKIHMTSEDFVKMMDARYAKVRIRLNTSSNDPVKFRTSDFIKIRTTASVELNSKLASK